MTVVASKWVPVNVTVVGSGKFEPSKIDGGEVEAAPACLGQPRDPELTIVEEGHRVVEAKTGGMN